MSQNDYTFLFPGQGSQRPGMGKGFYDQYEEARSVFERADSAIDISVSGLCFEADEDELRKTENTQPALFTASYAVFTVLSGMGIVGNFFAGHSLGEYTAVTAAGYLSFEDGLRVVRRRGELMRDCDPESRGGMAAVIGMDIQVIERVCGEIGDVYPANYNSPVQTVITGVKEKVDRAADELKRLGAKRVVTLNVGGPFHSHFMKDAAHELEREFEAVEWHRGGGSIVSNVTARFARDTAVIKANLISQLYRPVLWNQTMKTLLEEGDRFIESGPGGVLKGLFRAYSREAHVFSVEKPDDLNTLEG